MPEDREVGLSGWFGMSIERVATIEPHQFYRYPRTSLCGCYKGVFVVAGSIDATNHLFHRSSVHCVSGNTRIRLVDFDTI